MNTERPFPPELWEHIPAAVQGYIRALEARVTALETAVQRLDATVQDVPERVQQDSRTSSRPPSSDPPQAHAQRPRHDPRGGALVGNLGMRGRRGRCSP